MSLPGAKLKICIGFSHFQKPVLENQIKLLLVAPHKVGFRGHLSLWTHILFEGDIFHFGHTFCLNVLQ